MKPCKRLMKGLAPGLCVAAAGLGLASWVRRWWLAKGARQNEMGERLVSRCEDLMPCPVPARCRPLLPVGVPAARLRLLQLLAGLIAVCLGVGVYLLVAGPQSNGIAAGAAVFVAVMEGFLTWLLPALFVETS